MKLLYSIGHSNASTNELLSLLQIADVNCVVDVRSMPASKYCPQFNKDALSSFLKGYGIFYLHFGNEFGARRFDSIENGQVNFEKTIFTDAFQYGVKRIIDGINKGFTISLMCSEADPLSCHRFSLISRYFNDNGFHVMHILHSQKIVDHEELEQQMIDYYLKKNKLSTIDELFGSYSSSDQRDDAYRIKNKEIGFKVEDSDYEDKI